jgi:hypothetical protein
MNEKPSVKVMALFETSVPGEFERESLWARPTKDGYELENIPFYVQSLALHDVVAVNKAADGGLDYGRARAGSCVDRKRSSID